MRVLPWPSRSCSAIINPTNRQFVPTTHLCNIVKMKTFVVAILFFCLLGCSFAIPINGPLEEEMSGKFEGDIELSEAQSRDISKRTGLLKHTYRWPYNIVPYVLNDQTEAQKEYIREALDEMESHLCLRFVERTTESNYVNVISSESGCFSSVGMVGGVQRLNLQSYEPGLGCFRKGTIIHEFIHAIGFYHMQSATERDSFVNIVWDNIEAGKEHNFNTYGDDFIYQFGVKYDYGSVMHYSSLAFSNNGERTIVALDVEGGENMGQRLGMSALDINRINNMYC